MEVLAVYEAYELNRELLVLVSRYDNDSGWVCTVAPKDQISVSGPHGMESIASGLLKIGVPLSSPCWA